MGKKKKLRWGVAGCGRYTENSFLPGMKMLKNAELVSVFSHKLQRAEEIKENFNGEYAFSNYDDFLKSDFDLLFVGSVNSDHHWQVIKAAKAGKHIICEKPLAITSDQAKEMVEVCRDYGVRLSVNYVHRVHPVVKKAKEIIEAGTLGKLISVHANFNINFAPNDNFRFSKEKSGGGAMRDLGTHMLDLLLFLGGPVTESYGFTGNQIYEGEVEDSASALFRFRNGASGAFNVSYNCIRGFNRIEVLGHNGGFVIEKFIGHKTGIAKLVLTVQGELKKVFRKRTTKIPHLIKDFQDSILAGKDPSVTGEQAYENMLLMEKIENNAG